jgi:hypothetical protein
MTDVYAIAPYMPLDSSGLGTLPANNSIGMQIERKDYIGLNSDPTYYNNVIDQAVDTSSGHVMISKNGMTSISMTKPLWQYEGGQHLFYNQ